MFLHILSFEIRYWLRRPMPYIFMGIYALLAFGAVSSDNIQLGGTVGNIHKNAPYVLQNFFGILSLFGIIMSAAFIQGAALRDFENQTNQIVFSSPIRKIDYLLGRFIGAYFVSVLCYLGISVGVVLASFIAPAMGWLEPERIGPNGFTEHLNSFVVFALPNTFISGAVIFSLAALTRSSMYAFIGAISLLIGYIISGTLLEDVENEKLANLLDMFGVAPFFNATQYWTPDERNTQSLGFFDPTILFNRLLWIGLAIGGLVLTALRFNFHEKAQKVSKKKIQKAEEAAVPMGNNVELQRFNPRTGTSVFWGQVRNQSSVDFKFVVKNTTFIVLMFAGIVNMFGSLSQANKMYGLTMYPVTYNIIDQIDGSMGIFTLAIMVFYSGMLLWKERDAKMEQIYDAMPHKTWVSFLGKLLAMLGVMAMIMVLCIGMGLLAQLLRGFTDVDLNQYFVEFFVQKWLSFIPLIIFAMLVHTLVNNKYVGYMVFLVIIMLKALLFDIFDIESHLVNLFTAPNGQYSDMNGFGPFLAPNLWFRTYWIFFAGILGVVSVLYWVRGKDTSFKERSRNALANLKGNNRIILSVFVALFTVCGAWLYFNTKVLNHYDTSKQIEQGMYDYEISYKKYQNMVQPKLGDIKYFIDIFPEQRNLNVRGEVYLVNPTGQNIDTLIFAKPSGYSLTCDMSIPGAKAILEDDKLNFYMFRLDSTMRPGDSIRMTYNVKVEHRGIENEVSYSNLAANGTFFDNTDITPIPGYQESSEISNKNKRRERGLPERERTAKLVKHDCTKACMSSFLSFADWVQMETVISTSADQIAVAPGSLVKEWSKDSRKYFQYKLDHKSLAFGSFISARYQVHREQWKGVNVEVYYDAKHPYNVKKMADAVKASLDYYTANFGPYFHKQARILEFPRYQTFAQAFPGTMPYSEAIGFIANIEDENDVDMVYYVVAHEMAHQYWAHQVVSADMQGASMLSETFAQYSAMMVMEKRYGKDNMKRFLSYEMDKYLNGRAGEVLKETPLKEVENQQYIHYQKGSVAMYYLKEMIGEDKVNAALNQLIARFAYMQPPYPTSEIAVQAFRQQTPDSLQYVIDDLFEKIVIFDNRVLESTAKKTADGQYEVTLKVQSEKFNADAMGKQSIVPLNDFIDLAVFAKPEGDKPQGKILERRRIRMSQKQGTYTFKVKEEPYEAGIDPLNYLIDRIPDDNVKKVSF